MTPLITWSKGEGGLGMIGNLDLDRVIHLQVGDYVAVGTEWGRVRAMRTAGGASIKEALPGQPAEISGLRGVPQAGDELMALPR